jgi:DNA-directed RNA polymerase subunit M/transcription elongation factor TFIIS
VVGIFLPPLFTTYNNMNEQYCRDCGEAYIYDSSNPLGCSSVRCCKCRKKNSKLNIKFALMEIAGDGVVACRKCGYNRNVSALKLVDAVLPLSKPKTKYEIENQATRQYIICLNCDAEIHSEQVSVRVTDARSYPVLVSFYESRMIVEEISTPFSSPTIKMEVTKDEPNILDRNIVGSKLIDV